VHDILLNNKIYFRVIFLAILYITSWGQKCPPFGGMAQIRNRLAVSLNVMSCLLRQQGRSAFKVSHLIMSIIKAFKNVFKS